MKRIFAIVLLLILAFSIASPMGMAGATADEIILTPHQAVAEMKIGSNLGGIYDAIAYVTYFGNGYDNKRSGQEKVDFWRKYYKSFTDKTDYSSIFADYADAFYDAGYNVIRLGISWTPHMDDHTFLVDALWLEEIARAVDYITGKGMYCIINAHYDYLGRSWVGDHWADDWIFDEYKEYVDARFVSLWTQVAERFKSHGNKLIFEAFNEPGNRTETDDFDAYMDFATNRLNELNALFVKTIRDTGDQNERRFLLIGGYGNNNPKRSCIDRFVVPEDSNLIMSFHIYPFGDKNDLGSEYPDYLPSNAKRRAKALIAEARKNAGDASDVLFQNEVINEMFNRIDEFKKRTGVPVIVGEWGSTEAFPIKDRIRQAEYFVRRAKQSGIPCLWWENESDEFSLFDSEFAKDWKHKDLLDAIIAVVNSKSIGTVTIENNNVKLRAGVDKGSDVVGKAKRNQVFECVAIMENDWYEIVLDTGEIAYVSNKQASFLPYSD